MIQKFIAGVCLALAPAFFLEKMNKVPMTVAGEAALREELTDLKSVQRPAVIAAIAEAREHGDLKENAEYHAAREQQGFH